MNIPFQYVFFFSPPHVKCVEFGIWILYFWIVEFGYLILVNFLDFCKFWIWDFDLRFLVVDSGSWMLDLGFWTLDCGF